VSQQSLDNTTEVNEENTNPAPSAENGVEEQQTVAADAVEQETNEEPEQAVEPEKREPTDEEKRQYAINKRISAINREKQRALEEKQRLEEELNKYKQQSQPAEAKEPSLEDFDTAAEYQQAMRDYLTQDLQRKQQAETQKQMEARQRAEAEKRMQEQAEAFNQKIEPFKKAAPDFEEVYADLDVFIGELAASPDSNKQAMQVAASYVLDSPKTAEMIYHLGKNPHVVDEISRMTPYQATKRLSDLETSLASKPVKQSKPLPEPANTQNSTQSAKSWKEKTPHELLAELGVK